MRVAAHSVVIATGLVGLISSAFAAELTGAEIKDLISGKSVYSQSTAASSTGTAGPSVIYYAADGTALYKTAGGTIWHGKWSIKDNTACVDWKEKPNNPCSKYDKQGDAINIVNVTSGEVRAKVVKIAAGNSENIAP
jgi:hypothetical protein